MATATFTIDPAILEAARLEAERRHTSLDQMVSDYLASISHETERAVSTKNLVRLMNEGVLGDLGKLPTREEIYAERTPWPRS